MNTPETQSGGSLEPVGSVLAQCAEWHKNESKRHKTHRLFMEANNLGPPYPKSYEKRHADFAKACLAATSPNDKAHAQPRHQP